jgi:hypothetical protein
VNKELGTVFLLDVDKALLDKDQIERDIKKPFKDG